MKYFDDEELLEGVRTGVEIMLNVQDSVLGTVANPRIIQALGAKRDYQGVEVHPGFRLTNESVENLPITMLARNLHNYVFTGRRDTLGGILDSSHYIRCAIEGFAKMALDAVEYEFNMGNDGLMNIGKLYDMARESETRYLLDGHEDIGGTISLEMGSQIANMSDKALRNAAGKGEIRLEKDLFSASWKKTFVIEGFPGHCLEEWFNNRRGFIKRPDGTAPLFDSTLASGQDDVRDAEELLAIIHNVFSNRNVDEELPLIEMLLDAEHEQRIHSFMFDAAQWVQESRVIGLDPMWLMTRCFHSGLFWRVFWLRAGFGDYSDLNQIHEVMARLDGYLRREQMGREEHIRVPVSSDGSWFHPSNKLDNGYQIGRRSGKNEDTQRYRTNYWEALRDLEQMNPPYWSRPHPKTGKMGTVKGVSWKTISRREIVKLVT